MRRTDLEAEYEWYLEQATNPDNPPEERDLWRQLAEGLARRLDDKAEQKEGLW